MRVVAYQSMGIQYDLGGNVIGEIGIESTLSPIDFVGGFAMAARTAGGAGLRALFVQDIRSAAGLFTRAGIKKGAGGALISGTTGASFTVVAHVLSGGDVREIDPKNLALDFAWSAVYGALIGRVMSEIKLGTELGPTKILRELVKLNTAPFLDTLETLVRQQGVLAPAALLGNLIRSYAYKTSQGAAVTTTARDAAAGIVSNYVLQVLMLGSLGDKLCGKDMPAKDRINSTQAGIVRAVIGQARQALVRELSGLTPGATQKK
jgi:hypothetical protein